jgi:uncharacterized protein
MTHPIFEIPRGSAMKIRSLHAMKFLFALGLIGLAPHALAASFDCSKAASTTEKLICSDTETSTLDGKLQQAYKTALMATDAYGKNELTKEQRNWIRYTRDICQGTTCMQQVYTDRIAVLARNEENIVNGDVYSYCEMPRDDNHIGGDKCVNVLPYRDPNYRIGSFNQSLAQRKQHGKIIGCSRLIDLPVGFAGSNHSFGAVCTLQDGAQRKNVAICNDDMFGHFQMQSASSQDASGKHLIDFTYAQCYGG